MRNLRISEVAEELGVSLQTVRNWLQFGDEFFTPLAQRATRKRFTEADIDQLKLIKSLRDSGVSLDNIRDRLQPVPQTVKIEEDYNPPPKSTASQVNALQREYIQTMINGYDIAIQVLQDENERLRAELDRLRLPWFKRLF